MKRLPFLLLLMLPASCFAVGNLSLFSSTNSVGTLTISGASSGGGGSGTVTSVNAGTGIQVTNPSGPSVTVALSPSATMYIQNLSSPATSTQSVSGFNVTTGVVTGVFTVVQPDNDTTDPPIELKTLTTQEGAPNMYHSLFLNGVIPNPPSNGGEFIITPSSIPLNNTVGTIFDRLDRPEIAMATKGNPGTQQPYVALRSTAKQFPNGGPLGDLYVMGGTTTIEHSLNLDYASASLPLCTDSNKGVTTSGCSSGSGQPTIYVASNTAADTTIIVTNSGTQGSTSTFRVNPATVTVQGTFYPGTNVTFTTAAGSTTINATSSGGGSPGGSNSELQYRGGASTFSPVPGSTVSTTGEIMAFTPNDLNSSIFSFTTRNSFQGSFIRIRNALHSFDLFNIFASSIVTSDTFYENGDIHANGSGGVYFGPNPGTYEALMQYAGTTPSINFTTHTSISGVLRVGSSDVSPMLRGGPFPRQFEAVPSSQDVAGTFVQALSNQTAPLSEWFDSGGTQVSSVDANGRLSVSTMSVHGPMLDNTNSAGTAGFAWTSNGIGKSPSWQSATISTSALTVSSLTVTGSFNLVNISTFSIGNGVKLFIATGAFLVDGSSSTGTSGQVFTSNGSSTGPTWQNSSGGGGVSVYPATSTVSGIFYQQLFPTGQMKLGPFGEAAPFVSNSTSELTQAIYFDDTSTQAVSWTFRMHNYSGRQLTADIISHSTNTSNFTCWEVYTSTNFVSSALATQSQDLTTQFNVGVTTAVRVNPNQLAPIMASVALSNTTVLNGDMLTVKLERQTGGCGNTESVGFARMTEVDIRE